MRQATEKSSFGSLLHAFRVNSGLTQEQLAERAGLSRRGIADLERGARRTPYAHTLERLRAALGLSDDEYALLRQSVRIRRQVDPEQKPRPLHNLPLPPTSFVGRQLERARLAELLDSESLVTLVGPVGVGNTRHALEACAEQTEARPDGVWLVELAPLSDANLEAAESICLVSGCATLDVLGQLIDKSLVQTDSQADGSIRYRMLETLREYAAERLQTREISSTVQQRHAFYFADVLCKWWGPFWWG